MARARAAALALLPLLASDVNRSQEPAPRRDTDLVERAASRLAQVEIVARGSPEVVSTLTADDLKIRINLERIERFALDRHCGDAQAGPEPGAAYGPGTFLLYFDQAHLTMSGRARALDLARELVPDLVRDGAEAMIVSDARALAVVQEPSRDAAVLLDALRRLEHDRTQWEFFAEEEAGRVAEVIGVLNDEEDVSRAIGLARSYQRQEHIRADKSWRRLGVLVGRLAQLPPPRTVVYFTDTIRTNPGEHYLSFFGDGLRRTSIALGGIASDVLAAGLSYERVLDEAASHGVSVYSVLAQGLVMPHDLELPTSGAQDRTFAVAEPSRRRFHDAQVALSGLAGETGGHAFLRGEAAERIASRLREDRGCLYVASFDPQGLPLDRPLRVLVEPRRSDLRLQVRGRLVLQSERARLASQLLGAFSLDRPSELGSLQATVIPAAWDDRGYRALLQVVVPPLGLSEASWDIGASLVHREKVRDEVSGRIAVGRPEVAVVLEHEVLLAPGLHEIVSVAHESASDFVLSDHLRFELPEPDLRRAVVAPIVAVQPTSAAFVRAGRARVSGSLGQSEPEPLDPARPTALLSLVCRGSRQTAEITIARTLAGSTAVEFPLLELDLEEDLCAQVRDVIPAHTLAAGAYRYEVHVLQDGNEIHRAERELRLAQAPTR